MNLFFKKKLLTCFFLFLVSTVNAEIISLELNDGKNIAKAEYVKGNSSSPLIILIHGFLQTREFSTITRLAESLVDDEYSVLSPTLSLGISDRVQSLSCEAIHVHSIDDEVDEINQWVAWAESQGYENIILIGHSAGATAVSKLISKTVSQSIQKVVLISLSYYGLGRPVGFETADLANYAKKALEDESQKLHKYALDYCEVFPTTASNFLSYYNWSADQVINAVSNSPIETYVILGSSDKRIGSTWVNRNVNELTNVHLIEGANHFFDKVHEFALLEAVENFISP